MSAIPMAWIATTNSNSHQPFYAFSDFKQTVKRQITSLGSSSKTAYKFLRDKVKILPVKQQLNVYNLSFFTMTRQKTKAVRAQRKI